MLKTEPAGSSWVKSVVLAGTLMDYLKEASSVSSSWSSTAQMLNWRALHSTQLWFGSRA